MITFIMREENLDYPGAVRFLADRAGISVPEDNEPQEAEVVSRKRMYEMNLCAAKFFRECLFDPKYGGEAMQYLTQERRLSTATIRHFGLGFSPNHFGMLTDHMHRLGFSDEELVVGFLCGKSRKNGAAYDYFRNRVIFPIIDTVGNIVAFGGRVMDDSKPKYLNTSDTPAFKKSRHLFALNFARKCAQEQMILCEGYMDVIALHAAGFENAVATLGTAITSEQSRIFAKYTKKVIICYDADNAGQTAASKAMRLLGEVGVEVRVLKLNGAKDPDEYIRKFGAPAFRQVLEESKTGFEFKLDKILGQYDISVPENRIKASAAVCDVISDTPSVVERDIYVRRAAEVLQVSAEALKGDVERLRYRKLKEYQQKQSSEAQMSLKNIGDRINLDAAKNIRANSAEEALLGLLLLFEDYRHDAASGALSLTADDFSTAFGRRVFEAICGLENSEGGFSRAMLGQQFNVDEMGRIEKMEQERRKLGNNSREVLLTLVDNLRAAKVSTGGDPFGDLMAKRAKLKKEKESHGAE